MSFKALQVAFSLDTSPMNQDAAALAERELRETPEQVQKSLAELRQLLKGTYRSSRFGKGTRECRRAFSKLETTSY